MSAHSRLSSPALLVALLDFICTQAPAAVAQSRVDLEPYAGLFIATTSLTSSGVLKQESSLSLGTRLITWLPGRVGLQWTVNYAASGVTPTGADSSCACGSFPFPGPSSAHVIAASTQVIARVSPAAATTTFHVGGGIGLVGHGGAAYTVDTYERNRTTAVSGILTAGAAFRLGQSLALRVDAEDYLFPTDFHCRYTYGTRGVCWAVNQAGTPSSSTLQNDLVLSLGLAVRVGWQ